MTYLGQGDNRVKVWDGDTPAAQLLDDAAQAIDAYRAALWKLSTLGNGNAPGNSDGNRIAQEALKQYEYRETDSGKQN